jgi:RNA polymerase sigma factor (sigma-70 family)
MILEKLGRLAQLYDLYGPLLTPRQQEAVRLYYEQDMSLAEIASECQVSRQAVHDILRRAEVALEKYEHKLGLLAGRHNNQNSRNMEKGI